MTKFKLREGIEFNCTENSVYGFEFFTFRSPPMVKEMDVFLEVTRDRKRLLDVGAFHGVFSLAFAARGGEAHAIEPSTVAWADLAANLAANDLKNIAYRGALSDTKREMMMGREWDHFV